MVHVDNVRKRERVTRILAEAAAASTIHGFPRAVNAKSRKLTIFWSVLIGLACIGATIHLYFMVKTYLSYPFAEISSTKEGVPIDFPAVTICNINPISQKSIQDLFVQSDQEVYKWFMFVNEPSGLNSFAAKLQSYPTFYENLPDDAKRIGRTFDDFILVCKFDNAECGRANFTTFFDSINYYNCFTFNSGFSTGRESFTSKISNEGGIHHGLSLILSLQTESTPESPYGLYNTNNVLQFGVGARVQIHAAGSMPNPASQGFDVSPGFSTTVGVETVVHSRLDKPHGNCTKENLKIHRKYRNTVSTCLQMCKQYKLVNKCGCRNSGFTLIHGMDHSNENVSYCSEIKNFSNWTSVSDKKRDTYLKILQCENNFLKELAHAGLNEETCGCFQPCTELTYKTSISTSYWPLEFYQFHLLQTLYGETKGVTNDLKEAFDLLNNTINKYLTAIYNGRHFQYSQSDLMNQSRASSLIRQNLIRLNIYVDNLRTTEYKTIPTYGIFDLLADVGGTLGLWLGISFLTIMELVELKLKLIHYFFSSTRKSQDINDRQDDVIA